MRRLSFSVLIPTAFLAASVLALTTLILVGTSDPFAPTRPLMPPRDYVGVRLAVILRDLETHGVIETPTAWQAPVLQDRLVTVRLMDLPYQRDALVRIARAADVVFAFANGHHGEVMSPLYVCPSSHDEPAGLRPIWHVYWSEGRRQ